MSSFAISLFKIRSIFSGKKTCPSIAAGGAGGVSGAAAGAAVPDTAAPGASHAGTAVSVTIFDFSPSVIVMNSGIISMKSVIFA